jgi:hypothetical protein
MVYFTFQGEAAFHALADKLKSVLNVGDDSLTLVRVAGPTKI